MTVNPGFGGQHFLTPMLKKIQALEQLKQQGGYDFDIEVDVKRGKRVTQHPGQRCLCFRKGFRPLVRHNGRTAMVTGSRSGGERDREGKASNAGKNVLSKEQFPCILALPPILPLL